MGKIEASIRFIGGLPFGRFNIPHYQRPYKWLPENVEKLLDSIKNNMNKEEYRIGSIIVNPNNGYLDLVDGQQRMITLALIFNALGAESNYCLKVSFSNLISKYNIRHNYLYIEDWLDRNASGNEKKSLLDFILNNCSVVFITVYDLSEAFQMFDSQNGRGKELEGYDLLKAYHIRAMDDAGSEFQITDEKKEIDRKWELAVNEHFYDLSKHNLMKYVVNSLYRIRRWSRKEWGDSFGKKKIEEFKGIQIHGRSVDLPLQNIGLLMYLFGKCSGFLDNSCQRRNSSLSQLNSVVSTTMSIVNGTLFFDYVSTYVESIKFLLFEPLPKDSCLCGFREHYKKYCIGYEGHGRSGDTYVRDMYIALVLSVFDRFGEEGVEKYYKQLYILSYKMRLEKEVVKYDAVAKYPLDYFSIIANASSFAGLTKIDRLSMDVINCRMLNRNEIVARFMVENGRVVNAAQSLLLNEQTIPTGKQLSVEDFNL